MKTYRYLLLISALLLTIGCGKWLDVTPKAQVGLDKMFSSEKGYEDVLLGCYTSMTKNNIYGAEMSYGLLDAIAQYYETDAQTHKYYEASRFNYNSENIKSRIDDLWLNSYYTIANCNILLDNLAKANRNIFTEGHDVFIEAEAKAIRAFMHFNLLRLFAPVYKNNENKLSIPYANEFRSQPFRQLAMNDFLKLLIADLDDSRKLLKDVDPVFNDMFKRSDVDYHFIQPMGIHSEFLDFRAYRMNYFAVTAMLARVYLFMGDKTNALKYAQEIIDNKDRFKFVDEGSLSGTIKNRNVNFQEEIIFALQYFNVKDNYTLSNASSSGAHFIYSMNDIYTFADDFRKVYTIAENTEKKKFYSLKYDENDKGFGGKVPLIRISEMFFIAAECIYEQEPQKACDYMNEVRIHRGILAKIEPSNYSDFMNEVIKECRREFLGEGQMLYMYKRLGVPMLKGASTVEVSPDKLILPLPNVEVEFGDYKFE